MLILKIIAKSDKITMDYSITKSKK